MDGGEVENRRAKEQEQHAVLGRACVCVREREAFAAAG